MDVHSYSRPEQARVRHLELDLNVNFQQKTLEGLATLHFDLYSGNELILDTRGLDIRSVDGAAGFELGAADSVLGAPLKIKIEGERRTVCVSYSTSPGASGLPWLDP